MESVKGLALDGGGVFGIGQAMALTEIDVKAFDFFAGTSIGSVLAVNLGLGYTDPAHFPDFFTEWMPKIFKGYGWRRFSPFAPRYNDKYLCQALQEMVPGEFGDCAKPVYVTAVDLSRRRLKVYDSTDASDACTPAWQVCRGAVAAESYFAPYGGFGDGGIFANNPSMVAIAAMCGDDRVKLSDLRLCSLGTGSATGAVKGWPEIGALKIQWGAWMIDSLLDGAANTMHEYFARSLNLGLYSRYDFRRDDGWAMDSPGDMLEAAVKWKSRAEHVAKRVNARFAV